MRDYDPTTGRYLQADPLGLVDGASVYGYALQNSLRFTDRTGLLVERGWGPGFGGRYSDGRGLGNPLKLLWNKICGRPVGKVAKPAASTAASTLATTDACGCDEDDKCKQISQKVENQALVVQQRLEDLVLDNNNLHQTARKIGDNWGSGSWEGHIQRFYKEQATLQDCIAEADSAGCPVSLFAREMARETPPMRPGYY